MTISDNSGTAEFWSDSRVTVGHNRDDITNQIAFRPGKFELWINGSEIWSPSEHPDPNPLLLRFDLAPWETPGFLIFRRIGVAKTGYHDDDEYQRSLGVYAPGAWDEPLLNASVADLSRYRSLTQLVGPRLTGAALLFFRGIAR
jgi:hypothetical protein